MLNAEGNPRNYCLHNDNAINHHTSGLTHFANFPLYAFPVLWDNLSNDNVKNSTQQIRFQLPTQKTPHRRAQH